MARIKGTPTVSELFERESIHAIANRYRGYECREAPARWKSSRRAMKSLTMGRSQRSLLNPLNQGFAIDAWLVDHPRHRVESIKNLGVRLLGAPPPAANLDTSVGTPL